MQMREKPLNKLIQTGQIIRDQSLFMLEEWGWRRKCFQRQRISRPQQESIHVFSGTHFTRLKKFRTPFKHNTKI